MAKWDVMVEDDLPTIINASWPQSRGCYWVEDPHPDVSVAESEAFVLDDCADDAATSMAHANGHEGDGEDEIIVREATPEEREEVMRRVNAWLAALEQP